MKNSIAYLAVIAILALAGCSSNSSNQSSQSAAPAAPPTPTATVDPSTAGTISGTVHLDGKPPKLRPINMSAEPFCEKAHPTPIIPPDVVLGSGGALANVVVYVKGGNLERYRFTTPTPPVVIDQRGCMYQPHVVALMTNQTLEVKNDDQTTHNVHALPNENPEWNESQTVGAAPIEQTFPQQEVGFQIRCNVHPWMNAYVSVFGNPYFAVTAKDGKFQINNLPPGTYTVEAWQEKFGSQSHTVTVAPKSSKEVSFAFQFSRR